MHRPPAPVALVAALAAATGAPGSDYPPLYDDTPEVAAGTYMVDTESFGTPFLIAMPDGWTADADFVTWGPHSSYVAWWAPTAAPLDSCSWKLAPMNPVATAAELAASMADQEQTLVGLPHARVLHRVHAEVVLEAAARVERAAAVARHHRHVGEERGARRGEVAVLDVARRLHGVEPIDERDACGQDEPDGHIDERHRRGRSRVRGGVGR